MGFLDKLLSQGARAIGDSIADAISGAVQNPGSSRPSGYQSGPNNRPYTQQSGVSASSSPVKRASVTAEEFDSRFRRIIENAGAYNIRIDVSPDELEREFGREIYERGGNRAYPSAIAYEVSRDGQRKLYVRIWDDYNKYSRTANRSIRNFCTANGIRILDFFLYLPNEEEYMEQRIRSNLV